MDGDSFYSASAWGFNEGPQEVAKVGGSSSSESDSDMSNEKGHDKVKPEKRRKEGKKRKEKKRRKRSKSMKEGAVGRDERASLRRRLEQLERLLEEAADFKAIKRQLKKVERARPTRAAMQRSFLLATTSGDLLCTELLLRSRFVDVDACDPSTGLPALHTACLLRDGPLAALLYRHGANAAVEDSSGETARDLGLDALLRAHEAALAAAEAEARAAERERRQRAALDAERQATERAWRERIAEAGAYDDMDERAGAAAVWGDGWTSDREEREERRAGGGGGWDGEDWWTRLAAERLRQRRAEWSARQQATATASGRRSNYGPYRSTAEPPADETRPDAKPRKGAFPAPPVKETAGFRAGSGPERAPPGPEPPRAGPSAPTAAAARAADPEAARAADSAAWRAFVEAWGPKSAAAAAAALASTSDDTEAAAAAATASVPLGPPKLLRMGDLPWPCTGDDVPLPGAGLLTPGELKVALRDLQRRWHPDKFSQRFGSSLEPMEREVISKRVVSISQAINAVSM